MSPRPHRPTLPTLSYTSRPLPRSTLFPYTTPFRSHGRRSPLCDLATGVSRDSLPQPSHLTQIATRCMWARRSEDRKSTRLNSSHSQISYAVFCLKKKIVTQCWVGAERRRTADDGGG